MEQYPSSLVSNPSLLHGLPLLLSNGALHAKKFPGPSISFENCSSFGKDKVKFKAVPSHDVPCFSHAVLQDIPFSEAWIHIVGFGISVDSSNTKSSSGQKKHHHLSLRVLLML